MEAELMRQIMDTDLSCIDDIDAFIMEQLHDIVEESGPSMSFLCIFTIVNYLFRPIQLKAR